MKSSLTLLAAAAWSISGPLEEKKDKDPYLDFPTADEQATCDASQLETQLHTVSSVAYHRSTWNERIAYITGTLAILDCHLELNQKPTLDESAALNRAIERVRNELSAIRDIQAMVFCISDVEVPDNVRELACKKAQEFKSDSDRHARVNAYLESMGRDGVTFGVRGILGEREDTLEGVLGKLEHASTKWELYLKD